MDNLIQLHALLSDEELPTIDPVSPVGDFHSSSKPNRGRTLHASPKPAVNNDDNDAAILSDVARVSLLEEQGMSVKAIAANLGLPTTTVLADIEIADQICHSTAAPSPLHQPSDRQNAETDPAA